MPWKTLKPQTQFPSPSPCHSTYRFLTVGDNGEGGWRAQIWYTSQAGASKSPGSHEMPLFIDPELPAGGKGEAVQEGGVGEGPALLPPQRPLQGCRSGAFVQALWRTSDAQRGAHLGQTSRGKAEALGKDKPRRRVRTSVSSPPPPPAPPLRGSGTVTETPRP